MELIRDGFSGVITDGMEIEDLVSGIERALTISHDQWQKMLENAYQSAQMVCTDEIVTNRLLRLYNKAVELNRINRSREFAWIKGMSLPAEHSEPLKQVEVEELSEPIALNGNIPPHIPRRITAKGLDYTLHAKWDAWSGLRIALATYKEKLSGSLHFEIYSKSGSNLLRSGTIDLAGVNDCMPYEFFFETIENSKGAEFTIRFSVNLDGPNSRLAIFEHPSSKLPLGRITRRLSKHGGTLFGDMLYGYFG